MANISRKMKWIAGQCAAIALVALATNIFETAGALPSHPAAVTRQPPQITTVNRSGKGDRLAPAAGPSLRLVRPPGCESPVSFLAKLSPPDLVGRCVT
jgi:hypothetical protein